VLNAIVPMETLSLYRSALHSRCEFRGVLFKMKSYLKERAPVPHPSAVDVENVGMIAVLGSRRGDSHPLTAWYYLCIVSSPCLNRYIFLNERSSDSSFDSLCFGVPPKSPDHQDMNPSSI
jgi:hypothetical protein